MATRTIVRIDEDLCDGCGECIPSCAEGALMVIGGVAKLVNDRFCDGMGNCLGICPQDAITLEERDAVPFDLDPPVEPGFRTGGAVRPAVPPPATAVAQSPSCPGAKAREIRPEAVDSAEAPDAPIPSALRHWPVQLQLLSPGAPGLRGADLLLCADCVPFAYPDFHPRFLHGHAVAVACPKLDNTAPYAEKLTTILFTSQLKSLTILRMEVPCCGGLVQLARHAHARAGGTIPLREVVIGVHGDVLAERSLTTTPPSCGPTVADQTR